MQLRLGVRSDDGRGEGRVGPGVFLVFDKKKCSGSAAVDLLSSVPANEKGSPVISEVNVAFFKRRERGGQGEVGKEGSARGRLRSRFCLAYLSINEDRSGVEVGKTFADTCSWGHGHGEDVVG